MLLIGRKAFHNNAVMAGHGRPKDGVASARLSPAIHVLANSKEDVDARHKAGHDEVDGCAS
jgi:hypothetical protein